MQTTVMIAENSTPKSILMGVVFPIFRPSITPQTIPATPPPNKAIPVEALPSFAPNKTAIMVSKIGVIITEKKINQLVLTGGN